MPVGDLNEFNRRFDGTPMKRPVTDVTIAWGPETTHLPKGDYPHLLLSLPVFSLRAVEALRDLLEGNGEILPTTCEGDQLFLLQCDQGDRRIGRIQFGSNQI